MKSRENLSIATAVGLSAFLAGCASPIKSVHTSQLNEVEGISYMLSRTVATVTFVARLDDCGDEGKSESATQATPAPQTTQTTQATKSETKVPTPPTVSILAPSVEYASIPDPDATYVINPRDAWNLFRTIDVQKLELSEDGRIAALQVSTTDNTVTNLLEIAKAASGLGALRAPALMAERAAKPDEKPLVLQCIGHGGALTDDTPFAWTKARSAAKLRIAQLKDSIAQLQRQPQQHAGTSAALESMSADIAKLTQEVKRLDTLLTKRAEVKLATQGAAVAMIDLKYGWFDNESKSCSDDNLPREAADLASSGTGRATDVRRDLKDKISMELKNAKREEPQKQKSRDLDSCYVGVAKLGPVDPEKPLIISDPVAVSGYAGLLYRIPGPVRIALSVAAPGVDGVKLRALDDFGGVTPATHPETWESYDDGKGRSLYRTDDGKMLQFGRMAKMPADIGLLTTNSVSAEFDKNGKPKSAKWKAEPVQLAALLGLPAKLQPSAPPAEPSATQVAQRDLLNALLKSCLDALAASSAPPAYCSAILK